MPSARKAWKGVLKPIRRGRVTWSLVMLARAQKNQRNSAAKEIGLESRLRQI